jgi:WD40 repeat protein
VQCSAFALDSNLLASGSRHEIKLWNVEDGVCIHSFHHHHGRTISLVFTGVGESIRCWAATTEGSLIRISSNISLSEFVSDLIVVGAARFLRTAFSLCGSFLARVDLENKLCLHEIETEGISMAQSVTLTGYPALRTNVGMAFSPDNKMLASILVDTTDEDDTAVLLIDVKDLTLQRQLGWKWRGSFPVSLAFDPSSRYLATLFYDGSVRLWSV